MTNCTVHRLNNPHAKVETFDSKSEICLHPLTLMMYSSVGEVVGLCKHSAGNRGWHSRTCCRSENYSGMLQLLQIFLIDGVMPYSGGHGRYSHLRLCWAVEAVDGGGVETSGACFFASFEEETTRRLV